MLNCIGVTRQTITLWEKGARKPDPKERLEIIFENQFSCVKTRMFDGSFLTFPGMTDQVHLYSDNSIVTDFSRYGKS